MGRGLGVLGCVLGLAAAACGAPATEEPAAEGPAGKAPAAEVLPAAPATEAGGPALQASIHPDLPGYSFRLVGQTMEEGSETFAATALEIRRGGEAEPVQVIEDLAIEAPTGEPSGGIEVVDMNFDGYGDLRVVEFLPAGPNVPYLNWLFDTDSERFAASPELDEITSPIFDAATRSIRSEWRDGAATYGTHIYEVVGGRPVLVRRERRQYSEPGVYERTVSELRDGEWQVVERETARDG